MSICWSIGQSLAESPLDMSQLQVEQEQQACVSVAGHCHDKSGQKQKSGSPRSQPEVIDRAQNIHPENLTP